MKGATGFASKRIARQVCIGLPCNSRVAFSGAYSTRSNIQ